MLLQKQLKHFSGPLMVGIAALLWSTDALFRVPLLRTLSPIVIVLFEHLLATLILLPWILMKHRRELFHLNAKEWLAALFIGIGGSALATVLFTSSFQYINPSVAVLLQKLQPIATVLLAYLFLGERPSRRCYEWAPVALLAALLISFPELRFGSILKTGILHTKGIMFALLASAIWSATTVFSKSLLNRTSPAVGVFWRYVFGLIGLIIMLQVRHAHIPWNTLQTSSIQLSLLYLCLLTGVIPMLWYFHGLARTSASVTTFIELLHPAGAVLLNTIYLSTPLDRIQVVAGILLLIAISRITAASQPPLSRTKKRRAFRYPPYFSGILIQPPHRSVHASTPATHSTASTNELPPSAQEASALPPTPPPSLQ